MGLKRECSIMEKATGREGGFEIPGSRVKGMKKKWKEAHR